MSAAHFLSFVHIQIAVGAGLVTPVEEMRASGAGWALARRRVVQSADGAEVGLRASMLGCLIDE